MTHRVSFRIILSLVIALSMYSFVYASDIRDNGIFTQPEFSAKPPYPADMLNHLNDLNQTRNWRWVTYQYNGWSGSDWMPIHRTCRTYTYNEYVDEYVQYDYIDYDWVYTWKMNYTYNNEQLLTLQHYQEWVDGNWENYMQIQYTYDNNHRQTQELHLFWQGNAYVNSYKYVNIYNTNGQLDYDYSQHWVNNTWVNQFKSIYSYNAQNQVSIKTYYNWTNNAWAVTGRSIYSYNGFGVVSQYEHQTWNSASQTYTASSRMIYTYNTQQQLFQVLSQQYMSYYWADVNLSTYSYDYYGNQTELLVQLYNGGLVNYSQYTFEYEEYTSNQDEVSAETLLSASAYPNPFAGSTSISCKSDISGPARLCIYNIKGQLVKADDIILSKGKTTSWQWNDSAAAGIYLLKIRHGCQTIKTLKLIKLQ